MTGLPFTLTTAGAAALINPANTGTNALTVSHIGISSVAVAGGLVQHRALGALPNELKRLATFGGSAADDVIHVTLRDESADAYPLRAIGLYLSNGVLLAVFSQPTAIMVKATQAILLLSADLKVSTPIVAELRFGDANFSLAAATTIRLGLVELATPTEARAGLDAERAVTPSALRHAQWRTLFLSMSH